MALTITESLAEIKTIDARIAKKTEFIKQNLVRQEGFKDPLERDGGSRQVIIQERQSIGDLQQRKLTLRRAIQRANDETIVSVGGTTQSISDWLVWRREVAPVAKGVLQQISGVVQAARNDAQRKGFSVVTTGDVANKSTDLNINVDEKGLAEQIERLETTLGELDGQLSLRNATVNVTIA